MIRCIRDYKSADHSYQVGDIVPDSDHADWLLRDSPGSWEVVTEDRAVEDAPNRMVTNETPKVRTRRAKAS